MIHTDSYMFQMFSRLEMMIPGCECREFRGFAAERRGVSCQVLWSGEALRVFVEAHGHGAGGIFGLQVGLAGALHHANHLWLWNQNGFPEMGLEGPPLQSLGFE